MRLWMSWKKPSPKRYGKYRRSWKKKKLANGSFVVFNAVASLTHILENGHISRNGGRVAGIVHIKPAEEKAIQNFEKRIKEIGKWSYQTLLLILEQVNLPVTYRAFKIGNAPDLPYLVYYESSPVINAADNTVNHQIKSVTVELAFESKDEDLEERLEELWTTHELFFDVQEETFIDTERLYVKSYTVYLY